MDDWLKLFRRALAVIDAAPPGLVGDDWTLGGGTMLFRRYGHRTSRDIHIFLSSPQSLTALSPRLNDEAARRTDADATYVEQSNFLKLTFPDGDIDFVVAPHLMQPYAEQAEIAGRPVWVETPAEILAKKVLYRADDFTARDVFDFAFLTGTGDADALLTAPRTYLAPLHRIAARLGLARPALEAAFVRIDGRAFRPSYDQCEAAILAFIAAAARAH